MPIAGPTIRPIKETILHNPRHRRAILQLIADGLTVKQAAAECGISLYTVKNYLKVWREDAGADTTYHLIAMALRRKEIE